METWVGVCLFTAAVTTAPAVEMRFESAGTRFGLSTAEGSKSFHQAEVFAELGLPWRWYAGTNWYCLPQIEMSSGWIGDGVANAFIATAGVRFVVGRERFPVRLIVGSNPTIISRDEFETRDFAIPFQLTTYAGFECNVGRRLSFGYRYQHMSSAGIAQPNPGLNLQMFSLSYRF